MPAQLETSAAPSNITVALSTPVQLAFSLFAFCKAERSGTAIHSPWFEPLERAHPDLGPRMHSLWAAAGDQPGEWGEILVLAQRSGHLLDEDLDGFFADLPKAATLKLPHPPLPGESEEERASVHRKLDTLRERPDICAAFVDLLRDFWAALRPWWEPAARRAAAEFAATLRTRLERTSDWKSVVVCSMARREPCASLAEEAFRRGELVAMPLTLSREGQLTYALPGLFIVAVGPDTDRKEERLRLRAERAAATFKLFSDPTRNQLVLALLYAPHSITDLANVLDLSQPTVSVHVKMLREAGLLDSTRSGAHTLYRLNEERTRAALGRAADEIFLPAVFPADD